jgi:hypothetical protein
MVGQKTKFLILLTRSSHNRGNKKECPTPKIRVYLNFGALPL